MSGALGRLGPPLLLRKRQTVLGALDALGIPLGRVLNVGSKSVRYEHPTLTACVNVDLVPGPGVHVVADAHELTRHVAPGTFDTAVLAAMLQYCHTPARVIAEAVRALRPRSEEPR